MQPGLTIVTMAAGLGRRFGGLKQIAPVGPAGEALIDLTLSDAAAAGFGRAIVVVRSDIEREVVEHVRRFAPPGLSIEPVRQDSLGPPRARPWGTAHAVLACRSVITGPFAVANSDDTYGGHSLQLLARHLAAPAFGPGRAAVVGFRVENTLSAAGGVTRAICRADGAGRLLGIEEQTGVRRSGDLIVSDRHESLPEGTVVSMNLWGFHPSVLDELARQFESFAPTHRDDDSELLLPDAVSALVRTARLEVTVLPTDDVWYGITFAEDVERARAAFGGRT